MTNNRGDHLYSKGNNTLNLAQRMFIRNRSENLQDPNQANGAAHRVAFFHESPQLFGVPNHFEMDQLFHIGAAGAAAVGAAGAAAVGAAGAAAVGAAGAAAVGVAGAAAVGAAGAAAVGVAGAAAVGAAEAARAAGAAGAATAAGAGTTSRATAGGAGVVGFSDRPPDYGHFAGYRRYAVEAGDQVVPLKVAKRSAEHVTVREGAPEPRTYESDEGEDMMVD